MKEKEVNSDVSSDTHSFKNEKFFVLIFGVSIHDPSWKWVSVQNTSHLGLSPLPGEVVAQVITDKERNNTR
jgi:archaellum component FlaG (FlaF/FlaG flagellin family)